MISFVLPFTILLLTRILVLDYSQYTFIYFFHSYFYLPTIKISSAKMFVHLYFPFFFHHLLVFFFSFKECFKWTPFYGKNSKTFYIWEYFYQAFIFRHQLLQLSFRFLVLFFNDLKITLHCLIFSLLICNFYLLKFFQFSFALNFSLSL